MSYNGSGTFNINSTGQPVVAGTVISSSAFNSLTNDLATGLTTAITKDGQTTTTARITFAQGLTSSLVTDSSSISTGSIITAGGAGIAKNLYVGGIASFSAQPIFTSLTASSAVATDASKGLVSVTNTGTGNNVLATSPTLTTPVISSIVNTGTLTLPTSTDTLVGRATTDTLTNKTLTSPVIATITNTGTLTLPTVTGTLIGTGTVSMVVYTASTTISVPSGASIGLCQVWGAGGGSGGSGTAPGAGGGGGGFGQQYFTAAQLTGQTLTIGTAGTAGASTPTAGGNGGTTSIGSLISATGGTGSAGANGGIAGGTGGTSSATFNVTGSAGGQNNYVASGGTLASGNGGGCFGVSNAVGVANVPGVEPGVGGNGNIVTSAAGNAGGKGRVVIFWS